jgi:hypothetical protein
MRFRKWRIKIRPTLRRRNGTVLIRYAGSDDVSEAEHRERSRPSEEQNPQRRDRWEQPNVPFVGTQNTLRLR